MSKYWETCEMRYVYGPVPSRRLGQSLGIDPIPLKTCNWNCVYCQLGRTIPVINRREEYAPPQEILQQVNDVLDSHRPGEIDWVTFVGSGEPSLHNGLGELIGEVKQLTEIPVAVITNGALLYQDDVRQELALADAVLPSVDAGIEKLFRQINRPHSEIAFARFIDGLIEFRSEYEGLLWVEVMLVRGLNDTEEALRDIQSVLEQIRPDRVHINLPTRPPVETWVKPPDAEGLMRATAILGEAARVVHPVEDTFDLSGFPDIVEPIVEIINRHPLGQQQLERILERWKVEDTEDIVCKLRGSGRVQEIERYGEIFWIAGHAQFPGEQQSLRTEPGAQREGAK